MITRCGNEWEPDHATLVKWEHAYHPIDIHRELTKAELWLEANPSRRKTLRGMQRFCVSWLNRAFEKNEYKGGAGKVRSTRDTSLEEDLNDTSWAS